MLLGYWLYLTMMYFLYRLAHLSVVVYFITLFIIAGRHWRSHSIILRCIILIFLDHTTSMASRLGYSLIGSYHIYGKKVSCFRKRLTFIILNTILVSSSLLLMLSLLHLLGCGNWTWRSQFALMRWSTTRSSFCCCLLLSLILLGNIWNLMCSTIEWLMHARHRSHPVILRRMSLPWLLLTLRAISSIWPNMTTATRPIHYLDWSIPKGRKNRLWIDICLGLSFLHLARLWSSVRHIG